MFLPSKPMINPALRILLSTNAIILLSGAMLGPIYALFVEDVGGDLLDASIAGGLFAVAAGIVVFLFGRWSDQVKESELIIVAGYLIVALGFLLLVFVTEVWMLFVVQVIIGFGEAVYSPAFDAVYSKHLTKKSAGAQWGAWESMNYFITAIGAILGGLIVTEFGFVPLFVIMSVITALSGFYILFLPRKKL